MPRKLIFPHVFSSGVIGRTAELPTETSPTKNIQGLIFRGAPLMLEQTHPFEVLSLPGPRAEMTAESLPTPDPSEVGHRHFADVELPDRAAVPSGALRQLCRPRGK